LRARHPNRPRVPSDSGYGQGPINDIIVGCPNSQGSGTGKVFIEFLDELGDRIGYRKLPNPEDVTLNYSPQLKASEKFGYSMASLVDFDNNGLVDFAVGAPSTGSIYGGSGTVYIIFMERVEYIDPNVNILIFYLKVSLPFLLAVIGCCVCVIYFFWHFRRKPDEIELAIKNAGVEVGLNRTRVKLVSQKPGTVYADEYA
jgi:hypothetical protein